MGVPKFYRWISERFPQINQLISGTCILPEIDNFYLDMNGIIHACTHPNDADTSQSLSQREMILGIFRYIDRMVTEIVKPKKILFLAIDGVAPRAKLNQQRARRFRSAQDRQEMINKSKEKGEIVDEESLFDSNCITPGTEFMEQVGKHLRWFIRKKIKEDSIWKNLKIIFSGHDVPGEGEHKIMEFIRELRADPNYEPNQRHCMYGQDADLIMLGLATHEPHFTLLREVIDFSRGRNGSARQTIMRQTKDAHFQLLHLSILREYLFLDFSTEINWVPDQERLIDDFIFLTFFVGNDFLPHLPTLDISEHAFDVLIDSYRSLMEKEDDYITYCGEIINFDKLEKLCSIIGSQEDQILQDREENLKIFNSKMRKRGTIEVPTEEEAEEEEDALQLAFESALDLALESDEDILSGEEYDSSGKKSGEEWNFKHKRTKKSNKSGNSSSSSDSPVISKDYRGRYYFEKFKIVSYSYDGKKSLDEIISHYLKGLMWCLAYYIKGCISWTWYYPYHYGPMLKDMLNLQEVHESIHFELGNPFHPFQQLLGCLPPASCKLLPRPYQWLMLNEESPIKKYYPTEFEIDQNGKRNPWEAVVLLDFFDESSLLEAEKNYCPPSKLTSVEKLRNKFGNILMYEFDPNNTETYLSCNPAIGLPDIINCQSMVAEVPFSIHPGFSFEPKLIPGTTYPIAGFPTITSLPLLGFNKDFYKINVFGSSSKYRTLTLQMSVVDFDVDSSNIHQLLGKLVYVNYPQTHEAKVLSISNEKGEWKLINKDLSATKSNVEYIQYDDFASQKWVSDSSNEQDKYLIGRGLPGTGGLEIGQIKVRLKVAPLQGLKRDPISGATKKVYSIGNLAEVPIQMALWSPPVIDPRFEEIDSLPLEKLLPIGSDVVAIKGKLKGVKGTVIGYGVDSTDKKQAAKKLVNVEFTLRPPEPPFGISIANSVQDEYFSSKDLCNLLKISPSILGRIVGSLRIEPGRFDIGLDLKKNGSYQLLGYARKIENHPESTERSVWKGIETVKIIGSDFGSGENEDSVKETAFWEFSGKAAAAIFDYKHKFPFLFKKLSELPHQPYYSLEDLFDKDPKEAESKLHEILDWIKQLPFSSYPRNSFSTISLSRDAMAAIERAADMVVSKAAKEPQAKHLVNGIKLDSIYSDLHRTANDTPLEFNNLEPRLGDRVINLACDGVPFGLKGTVVTIHRDSHYVEVIFDEEFIGGKSLNGNCSQFRGRLCPWSNLLQVTTDLHQSNPTNSAKTVNSQEKHQPKVTLLQRDNLNKSKTDPQVKARHFDKNSEKNRNLILNVLKREKEPQNNLKASNESSYDEINSTEIGKNKIPEANILKPSNSKGIQVLLKAAGLEGKKDVNLLPSLDSMVRNNDLAGVISFDPHSSTPTHLPPRYQKSLQSSVTKATSNSLDSTSTVESPKSTPLESKPNDPSLLMKSLLKIGSHKPNETENLQTEQPQSYSKKSNKETTKIHNWNNSVEHNLSFHDNIKTSHIKPQNKLSEKSQNDPPLPHSDRISQKRKDSYDTKSASLIKLKEKLAIKPQSEDSVKEVSNSSNGDSPSKKVKKKDFKAKNPKSFIPSKVFFAK